MALDTAQQSVHTHQRLFAHLLLLRRFVPKRTYLFVFMLARRDLLAD